MTKDKIFRDILPPILIVLFSIVAAVLTGDYFPGGLFLLIGFIAFFYQIRGKWYYHIFSILYTIIYSVISYLAGLYAYIVFAVVVYIPFYIYGMVSWEKKTFNGRVKTKAFSLKSAILLFVVIIVGGFGLGALMSLIPGQNMAFIDSTIQLFNVSAVILCSFRHIECWYAWIIQNAMTLMLWTVNMLSGATSAIMVLIINVVYCIGNFRAVYVWKRAAREEKQNETIDKQVDVVEGKQE